MGKTKVFLAEDHQVIREGLKLIIENQPDMEVIGEAGDGKSALEKILELGPDVVVIDISMPELSGTTVVKQVKHERPEIKMLVLSIHEDKGYMKELLSYGVSGYVLKRSAAEDFINAIRVVANGDVYLDPAVAGKVISYLVPEPASEEVPLSGRESEVLSLIAQGYSNKEIANRLEISVKTVETYKVRAMEKTMLRSRADIVRFAVKKGWLQG